MKNLFSHYALADFNKDLLENIKHKQVNFIQLFTAVDEAKVSVVMKPNDSETYYGLHPSFTQEEPQRVLNLIKSSIALPLFSKRVLYGKFAAGTHGIANGLSLRLQVYLQSRR